MGDLGMFHLERSMQRMMDLVCEGMESGEVSSFAIIGYTKPPELKHTMDGFEKHMKPEERKVYRHVDYPFNKGGAVLMRDRYGDSDNVYSLDLTALARGMDVFLQKCPKQYAAWIAEEDDAITGDCFIQCCLLGDVIYG